MSRWLWIGGVGLVILLALLVWGVVAGGKQIAAQPMQKVEEWVPGATLPRQDVGGEDIAGVPRFSGMMRVAFSVQEQKRRVVYKGKASFAEVIAFYAREMATRGFTKEVTAASSTEETHVYAKGNRSIALKFVKTARLGTEMTEVEVREL